MTSYSMHRGFWSRPDFIFYAPGFLEQSRLTGIGWTVKTYAEKLGPHEWLYIKGDSTMSGNAYNTLIATPAHYYLETGDVCHAAIIIACNGDNDTVTLRQLDGVNLGLPALADHANVEHHESETGEYNDASWHYQGSCANTS